MGKKIAAVLSSLILLGAVAGLAWHIYIGSRGGGRRLDLNQAYRKAYRMGVEAEELCRRGEEADAAEKYITAAEILKNAYRTNRSDPKAPGVRKKMLEYYDQGIALFVREAARQPTALDGRVTYVFDGDTIQIDKKTRIRYLGIDTPEKDRPFYNEATRANRVMVSNRTVQLKYERERQDRFGRTLAYVFCGGRFVNAELIKEGWARYYYPPDQPPSAYKKLFLACQALAREREVGMWSARR